MNRDNIKKVFNQREHTRKLHEPLKEYPAFLLDNA